MKFKAILLLGALTCESYPLINSQLFPPDPFTGIHSVLERCENEEAICYLLFHQADVKFDCMAKDHVEHMRAKILDSKALADKWQKK